MDEPTTLRAGDSASWTTKLPEYPPADGWTLKYRLLWPTGSTPVDITASVEEDHFKVTLTAAGTASYVAGIVTFVKWVEKGADRQTLGSTQLTILPDLTEASTYDARSANAKALANAEAALESYLAGGQLHVAEYQIAGRTMKFRAAQEIVDLINHYKRLVSQENALSSILAGGSPPGRVYYRG